MGLNSRLHGKVNAKSIIMQLIEKCSYHLSKSIEGTSGPLCRPCTVGDNGCAFMAYQLQQTHNLKVAGI